MKNFSIKIKTSIFCTFICVVLLSSISLMYFQYKSNTEFAIISVQKEFDKVANEVVSQVNRYDENSEHFLKIVQNIQNITHKPTKDSLHVLLPIISDYIEASPYVYGVYLGFDDDTFYIVYNLLVSQNMKTALNAPTNARWLLRHNYAVDDTIVSQNRFLDNDLEVVKQYEELTEFRPTQRPWYKSAIESDVMIKTDPYIFAAINEPGITYAQIVDQNLGVVLSLDITLSSLSQLLKNQKLAPQGAAFIYKDDGRLIGQYDEIENSVATNINENYKDIFIKDGKVLDPGEQRIITIDGVAYIGYTHELSSNYENKDYLSILTPYESIVKPYKDKVYESLLLSAIILIIFIFPLVYYSVNFITRPIALLREENQKVSQGDFDQVRPIKTIFSEIDLLSKSLVEMSDNIQQKTYDLTNLLQAFDKNVIASKTNLEGKITYASEAFCEISGYTQEELLGKPQNIVRHSDMSKEIFANLWETIQNDKTWTAEIKNRKKDGGFYWTLAIITPEYSLEGEKIGYSAIRQDVTAKKELEILKDSLEIKVQQRTQELFQSRQRVNQLLDNASQGFLYFDQNMIVGQECSNEVERIFGRNIAGENIVSLLKTDDSDRMFLTATLQSILKEDEFKQEILLSLLENEKLIEGKEIEIEYKVLSQESFMMILTDVTQEKMLAQKVKQEQQILKMVVQTVSSIEQFLELKELYTELAKGCREYVFIERLSDFRKEIHTYKGLFAQKEMLHIVAKLHHLETLIDQSIKQEKICNDLQELSTQTMLAWLEEDIQILKEILGDDIFDKKDKVWIDKKIIATLKEEIEALDDLCETKILTPILKTIQKLTYTPIELYLKPYIKLVEQLSVKLQKPLKPLNLKVDEIYLSHKYRAILNSLVHIFRNCVDHGIEDIYTRIESGKNEEGSIECEVKLNDDMLEIKISDDGAGIDREKIKQLAVEKGLYTQEEVQRLSDEEVSMLIFEDAFSTSSSISEISGRGVGLASLKTEVQKLGGELKVISQSKKGTEFIISVPFEV